MASFPKMNAILFGSCEGVEVWTIVFDNISQCIQIHFGSLITYIYTFNSVM
jgi:hypothetical protein